jgi:hypothetical protein
MEMGMTQGNKKNGNNNRKQEKLVSFVVRVPCCWRAVESKNWPDGHPELSFWCLYISFGSTKPSWAYMLLLTRAKADTRF